MSGIALSRGFDMTRTARDVLRASPNSGLSGINTPVSRFF
jgi:hypothetical protein